MFAADQMLAYYFKPTSVKSLGDKVVFTERYPVNPDHITGANAYVDDITVLGCKQPNWAISERTTYDKSGEVLTRVKWNDPEKLDLSTNAPFDPGSIYSIAQHLLCDEELRMPLLLPQQIANMKLTHLSSTPTGDGEMFYGPTTDISNPPYQKEMLFVIKYHQDHMFKDFYPGRTVRGLPISYRTVATLVQLDCTGRELIEPKSEYFDLQNNLAYVNQIINPTPISSGHPASPFFKIMNIACAAPAVAGIYEGINNVTYERGGQGEHKIKITVKQTGDVINLTFGTAHGAQGKGSGTLSAAVVEKMSFESTTPGCPGSYEGTLNFSSNELNWSYKGQDCAGPVEGHGTAKRTKS
jgi:hypothetical protein